MKFKSRSLWLLLLPCLAGCLSFQFGGRKDPTLADEIRDLKKLCDRGTISRQEYEMGKHALLRTVGPPHLNHTETQLATYPSADVPRRD